MSGEDAERTHRFAPLDRTGWLLGLSGVQCGSLAVGVLVAGALLERGAAAPLVLAPFLVSLVVGFGTWEGRPLHAWLPLIAEHVLWQATGRGRWSAEIPLLTGTAEDADRLPALPPFLRGLTLIESVTGRWTTPVGVVRDDEDGTLSATLPVCSMEFSLLERAEQDRVVSAWGECLAGFCTERAAVSHVRVTEWSSPGGTTVDVDPRGPGSTSPEAAAALASYAELVLGARGAAIGHEALVTVAVDGRRWRRSDDRRDAAIETLLDELRLLELRLDGAGLVADAPLAPQALADAIRARLDPADFRRARERPLTLAALAGLGARSMGPLATRTDWGHLTADGCLHRSYWVAEWPRLDVPPNWMEPFLLHCAGTRTVALHYEPVRPSRSQRRIDRDSTRLAADEEQRTRTGFRIGAHHRRAQRAVVEREAELVAGYAELEFAAFVTVTAGDEQSLTRACAEYEQAAAQVGLELRPLDGRHDVAFVCGLPVGRGLAKRRFA